MGRVLSLKGWLVLAFVIILVLGLLGVRSACSARHDAGVARETGKQLDKVAAQTPAIRAEQAEKEDEVEKIDGADQPLPPGFGAELERLRNRDHSR